MFFILQVWSFRLCALPTLYISCIIYYFSFRWGAVRFCFSFLLAKCLAHVFNVWWLGWEGMAAVPMLLHTTCFFGTPIIFLPARHGFPKLGPFFLLSPSQRLPSPVNVLAPTSKPRNLLATCVNQFNNTLFCLLDATPFYFFSLLSQKGNRSC